MKYNDIEFNTYFKNYPDSNGFFGKYGGSYIPPELQTAMNEKQIVVTLSEVTA